MSIADLVPESAAAVELQSQVSPERWAAVVRRARWKVGVLEGVEAGRVEGLSWRRALRAAAPDVKWPTFMNWRRCAAARSGPAWERQLDYRVPPEPDRVCPEVAAAACTLRRFQPQINCERARAALVGQFGEERGALSDASLKRVWKKAGLSRGPGGGPGPKKATEVFHPGGGGLALLQAAALETGVLEGLGSSVLEAATEAVRTQEPVASNESLGTDARDERGRFTPEYNRVVRGGSDRDPRLATDAEKRAVRDLSKLSVVQSRPELVSRRLFAMGLMPLLTERRGFDGLEGPSGAWLSVLGWTAYMPSTLDRFLSELALLDVGEALWTRHGQRWQKLSRAWMEGPEVPAWVRWAIYVDATQDPYWTRHFAASGKVSKVGRVMPCLTRVALMGGPGVPLLMETSAGSVSLKKELLSFLERAEAVIGKGELGRLTIVDAEMATVPLMTALSAREGRWFVTVLKGALAKGAVRSDEGNWERYRERDLVREVSLLVQGKEAPAGGLSLRSVEMIREGSRNPTSTLFVTDAPAKTLSTTQVASAYLSRWPHQEQRFRDGRNGLGMERSHGYGGQTVTHVALETNLEKAALCIERAETRLASAQDDEEQTEDLWEATPRGKRTAAYRALQRARRDRKKAERNLESANKEQGRLQTLPREIYMRDTTRDGIVTCLKLTVFMLIEFVLKEYFGGLGMEARSFIEAFVPLPATVVETRSTITWRLHDNPRNPALSACLRDACAEATRREIRLGKRRLRFEVAPSRAGPSRQIG